MCSEGVILSSAGVALLRHFEHLPKSVRQQIYCLTGLEVDLESSRLFTCALASVSSKDQIKSS